LLPKIIWAFRLTVLVTAEVTKKEGSIQPGSVNKNICSAENKGWPSKKESDQGTK
jgi:hypothetical protein